MLGPTARRSEHEGSGVDVLVVGDVDFAGLLDALQGAQTTLQREVNPKLFSARGWAERVRGGSSFVSELLDKPKIFLIGGEDDLGVPEKPSEGGPA